MPQSHGSRRRTKDSAGRGRGKRHDQATADASRPVPQDPADPNGTGGPHADPYGGGDPYAGGGPHATGDPGAHLGHGAPNGTGEPYGPGEPYEMGAPPPGGGPHEPGGPHGGGVQSGPSALRTAARFTPSGRTVLRVLTHNVTVTAAALIVLAAVVVVGPGLVGGDDPAPPKIAAKGMSANQMLEMMRSSEMDPVAADAIATAKKRAYEKQQNREKQAKAEKESDETAKGSVSKPEPTPEKVTSGSVGGGGGGGGGNTSVSENKAMGKRMNALKGWGCWSALESLWTKESNWNERAMNPSSGAYGIPQSLPGSKMASAGSDWQSNAATQIAWGLNYIDARYGTPCEAWGHSQSVGWY